MSKIEIIALRFNLDKEDDNRLFTLLQKRVPFGKRNELLKHLLALALRESATGGRVTGRRAKEASREPLAGNVSLEVQGPPQAPAPGTEHQPHPITDRQSGGQVLGGDSSSGEPEREAANLVGSLVQ
jgi:hypothetical protein